MPTLKRSYANVGWETVVLTSNVARCPSRLSKNVSLLSRWSSTKRWEITICQNRRAWKGRKLDHSGMTIWKDARPPASACHRRRMASVSVVYFLKCFSPFGPLDSCQRYQSSCVPHAHAKSRLTSPYWTTWPTDMKVVLLHCSLEANSPVTEQSVTWLPGAWICLAGELSQGFQSCYKAARVCLCF